MERATKRFFITDEIRTLLKKCFKNKLFCLVPFEIWKYIVLGVELKGILKLTQTCKSFRELIDTYIKTTLQFALVCRQQIQIPLAQKCLKISAEMGDADAMFHLGYAIKSEGWLMEKSFDDDKIWYEHAAKLGNKYGILACNTSFIDDIDCCYNSDSTKIDKPWILKQQKDSFICGYVYFCDGNFEMAKQCFGQILEEDKNNEFALILLGKCYKDDHDKLLFYFIKAANIGNISAISFVWNIFRYRKDNLDSYILYKKYDHLLGEQLSHFRLHKKQLDNTKKKQYYENIFFSVCFFMNVFSCTSIVYFLFFK